MYTGRITPLGKLRSYHAELTDLYEAMLTRRRFAEARAVFDRRVRVKRAILLREEWAPTSADTPDLGELLADGR